eukprot:gnl/MRDRNA2_/MRDRNA2_81457_c0_seq1.p1 gnl/MRDRNA2_/MRDRNA2_81457_c0~~gnl/MRDRNA2_/MRDRNA2_81457_c0_seq1.p1  ORF type:complete len:470 (-),score=93.68 gnl/MRDRNA2_/MRDRNA2_81457_c0_seq1:94-1503(-)
MPRTFGAINAGVAEVPYSWGRTTLEFSKEFVAHLLVMLTRALHHGQHKGEAPVAPVDVTYALWDWCGTYFVDYNAINHPGMLGSKQLPPLLSWNTRRGCNAVATPTYDWEYHTQNFTLGSSWRPDRFPMVPWEKRKAMLVWRGSITSWDGSRARAVRVSRHHADIMDIKVSMSGLEIKAATDHPPGHPEKSIACAGFLQAVAGAGSIGGPATPNECDGIVAPYLPIEGQMQYKFILDVDGGASSFRLKRDLLSGAVLFRVVHASPLDQNEQFFFPDLVPWKHFVPVSFENMETDLVKKVEWAIANDAEVRKIAEQGATFVKSHLREEDAFAQIRATLRQMSKKQSGWTPGSGSMEQSEPKMRLFCCEDLKDAAIQRPIANQILGRPASTTWSDADGQMFPDLFHQCVDLYPADCKKRGRADSAVDAAKTAMASLTFKPDGTLASFGTVAPSNASHPRNFFSTPLEWLPM